MMSPARARLLHVFASFGQGGVPLRICEIANRLGEGYQHTFYALDGDVSAGAALDPSLDSVCRSLPLSRYQILGNLAAYRKLIREEHPDLLLTYNWGATECALANSLARPVPHIHFESGFGPEEADRQLRRRGWFRRLALRRSHRIVVPSRRLFAIATESWGLDRARVQFISNGVDTKRFNGQPGQTIALNAHDESGSLTIGAVAPIRPEKNIARLLDAFAALGRDDLRLVIAGDGSERQALERKADSLGIAGRTQFLGHRVDVPTVLRSIDIFALTSDTEQMPNSLLQAMAAGLPVVAVNVGDVASILPPANRAMVCDKNDMNGLRVNFMKLIENSGLREELGRANQSHVRAVHGVERMVESYRALFDGALAMPRSAEPTRGDLSVANVKS
jgi:glycosyltransferase involved in cell wall biosynthesis